MKKLTKPNTKEIPWFEGKPSMTILRLHLGGLLVCPRLYKRGAFKGEMNLDATENDVIDLFKEYHRKGGKFRGNRRME